MQQDSRSPRPRRLQDLRQRLVSSRAREATQTPTPAMVAERVPATSHPSGTNRRTPGPTTCRVARQRRPAERKWSTRKRAGGPHPPRGGARASQRISTGTATPQQPELAPSRGAPTPSNRARLRARMRTDQLHDLLRRQDLVNALLRLGLDPESLLLRGVADTHDRARRRRTSTPLKEAHRGGIKHAAGQALIPTHPGRNAVPVGHAQAARGVARA